MPSANHAPTPTTRQRLCFALDASEREVEAMLTHGASGVDVPAIARRVHIDPERARRLIESPQAVEAHRVDPNCMTRGQIEAIPALPPERARAVAAGRPYFTLDELETATSLPRHHLETLFALPKFEFTDKASGRRMGLQPVPGAYVVPARLDFERVERLGWVERASRAAAAPIRVLKAAEFESASPPHELKEMLGGQVYPVLRDSEGCERLLVPGSMDVWFRADVAAQDVHRLLEQHGLRVKRSRHQVGYYQVELRELPPDGNLTRATLEKIEQLNQAPEVRFAEPDQVDLDGFEPERLRQVEEFEDLSFRDRSWNLELIRLRDAHAVTEGTPQVTVFVIDSGMRLDHPDLRAALRPDWRDLDLNFDLGVPDEELSPLDSSIGHGTRVAGIIAGRAISADLGCRGIAPGCWLLPVKISGLPDASVGYGLRAAAILQVVRSVTPQQRAVINLSWATSGEHAGIREALVEADQKGIPVVTSAGNYRSGELQVPDRPHYPSGHAFLPGDTPDDLASHRKIQSVISVAAVNADRAKSTYSYFGRSAVTLSAPGGEAGQAGEGLFLASLPADYAYGAGTSFAAPHVAGTIALMLSVDASLTPQRVVEILRQTAIDIDPHNPQYPGMLGAGLIDAAAAVAALGGSAPAARDTPRQPAAQLDINSATEEQLAQLPLLGEWTARIIVAHRAQHGPFQSVDQLIDTGAVDHWTLDQIRDRLAVTPAMSPQVTPQPPVLPQPDSDGRLNLNSAGVQQIAALPLLGPWTASRIIGYRDEHGPFRHLDQLTAAQLLDPWTLQQIQDLVTLA